MIKYFLNYSVTKENIAYHGYLSFSLLIVFISSSCSCFFSRNCLNPWKSPAKINFYSDSVSNHKWGTGSEHSETKPYSWTGSDQSASNYSPGLSAADWLLNIWLPKSSVLPAARLAKLDPVLLKAAAASELTGLSATLEMILIKICITWINPPCAFYGVFCINLL